MMTMRQEVEVTGLLWKWTWKRIDTDLLEGTTIKKGTKNFSRTNSKGIKKTEVAATTEEIPTASEETVAAEEEEIEEEKEEQLQ